MIKFYKANDLREGIEKISSLDANQPGNDMWWFSEKDVQYLLSILIGANEQLQQELLAAMPVGTIGGQKYFCIYIGEVDKIEQRIIKNHLKGSIASSTLRKTLFAILNQDNPNQYGEKQLVNSFLQKAYVGYRTDNDVFDFNQELQRHFYLLNIDANKHYLAHNIIPLIKQLRN